MINAANNLLAAIEKVNDANFVGERKKEIIAETRFLRAFAQLYLMKHYAFFWDLDGNFFIFNKLYFKNYLAVHFSGTWIVNTGH